jgi:hypothetical protein
VEWSLNMFLTRLKRAAVALSIATALANAEFAQAAEQSITPVPQAECEALARKISQAVGIKLSTKVGGNDFVADFLPGVRGNACLMSGRATGLKANFAEVQDKLSAVLSGWTSVNEFAADAPMSTVQGFASGAQRVVFALDNEPPPGTCQNVVIASCKVPARRWTWTLKVVAFSISSQSGM